MRPLQLALAVAVSVTACTVGTSARRFEPALGPRGVRLTARVDVPGPGGFVKVVEGELLAIRSTSLLLQAGQLVVEIERGAIRTLVVPQMFTIQRKNGRLPDARVEQLRNVSRFPQGLTQDLFRQLLDAYGQTEPTKVP